MYYISERPFNNPTLFAAPAWIKEERANLTAPLNDTETEIYGQSTNGAGDRSTDGRIDALSAGHYYRGQIYASFSIIPRPTLLFYYSCSVSCATKAPTRTHGHNSLRRRVSQCTKSVVRRYRILIADRVSHAISREIIRAILGISNYLLFMDFAR